MTEDYVDALRRCRVKLVEQRRSLVKRDCSTDRHEGYGDRIIAIQLALDATDRAILDEESFGAQEMESSEPVPIKSPFLHQLS